MAIEKGVGIPIRIDQATATKDLYMFARVLVEINFYSDLIYAFTIDRARASYEKLHKHWSHCHLVGHIVLLAIIETAMVFSAPDAVRYASRIISSVVTIVSGTLAMVMG
ncbi:hypothetical protein LguiA_026564 [Lonicera macranthoides]